MHATPCVAGDAIQGRHRPGQQALPLGMLCTFNVATAPHYSNSWHMSSSAPVRWRVVLLQQSSYQ